MEIASYAIEAAVQETHWWFVGRRRLFEKELRRMGFDNSHAVLDVGTSTGTNLALLRDMGFRRVTGLDMSEEAIVFCASKGLGPVDLGDACAMPFNDESFDLVLATDVIEHLDDDRAGLREISRVLTPDGKVLITVPAFPSLWGLQDRVSNHKRRYRVASLLDAVSCSGLKPITHYHFNYLLFVPIWLARRLIDVFKPSVQHEGQVNNPAINWILSKIFDIDTSLAPHLGMPFGVSILLICERK
ncbi:class I SAM-dependent methyltransferase [Bradyrhizobium algeriense]|uniref:class I SAM-dependent methyltransferase n=1 Tax=Bradyrhizobium algeriense TaxID=634784 RepID=UPI000D38AF24|nr:class I SAM-dependent methyltransferase [Bradyrhizobium algeriense]